MCHGVCHAVCHGVCHAVCHKKIPKVDSGDGSALYSDLHEGKFLLKEYPLIRTRASLARAVF